MRVELWRGAFSSTGAWDHWLNPALDAMRRRGHTLRIPPSYRKLADQWASTQTVQLATQFQALRDARQPTEVCHTRLTVHVEEGITARWPAPSSAAPCTVHLPPDDLALEVLNQPLSLLVENDRVDASFLRCVLPTDFRNMERRRWLQFRNGGGNANMRKLVEEDVGPTPEKRLRTWAMLDSDRTSPENIGSGANDLQRALQKAHIAHHMLSRRAVENYVTEEMLADWAGESSARLARQPWLQAFLAVPPAARRYFKLKPGAKGGIGNHNHADDAKSLFPHIVADPHHKLQRGPPGDLGELWREIDSQSRTVPVADAAEELRDIFRSIEEML